MNCLVPLFTRGSQTSYGSLFVHYFLVKQYVVLYCVLLLLLDVYPNYGDTKRVSRV